MLPANYTPWMFIYMSDYCFVNGKRRSEISIYDRGLAYGDGVFETIAVTSGQPEFLSLHLNRLVAGCKKLSIDCDVTSLQSEIKHAISESVYSNAVLKVIVTRAATGRGYKPGIRLGSERYVMLSDNLPDYSKQQQEGIKLFLCDTRLAMASEIAGLKHLAKLENVMASAECQQQRCVEGLMLDAYGNVVEGTMSNVFIVHDQHLVTPSLEDCGVAGIIRDVILGKCAEKLDLKKTIKKIKLQDLYKSDEIFICNSLMGIVPVTSVGCHLKSVGKITRSLQKVLSDFRQQDEAKC